MTIYLYIELSDNTGYSNGGEVLKFKNKRLLMNHFKHLDSELTLNLIKKITRKDYDNFPQFDDVFLWQNVAPDYRQQ
jgi:hypothetical protein